MIIFNYTIKNICNKKIGNVILLRGISGN